MTTLIEGKESFFINTPAILIDDTKDVASNWASEHIKPNPGLKWVLAKYVEADNANSNGQYFSLDDLRLSQPTVNNSPMNIDHHQNEIVGTWVSSELLYPTDSSHILNPFVEVLGAYWKHYFPERLVDVEAAFNSGTLYVSMECFGSTVTCVGTDDACNESFPYEGPFGEGYCAHIKDRASYRQIDKPQFVGGALIVPPNKPGWKSATVNEMSGLVTKAVEEKIFESIAEENPELPEEDIQNLLQTLTYRAQLARFTTVS